MAWYSYTTAFAISADGIPIDADPRDIFDATSSNENRWVFASSRRGYLLGLLGDICKLAICGEDLYLLKEFSIVWHDAVKESARQIQDLIDAIRRNPRLVLDATKRPHRLTTTIYVNGPFEPIQAQYVYSSDAIIEDGWVYDYTEQEVLDYLDQSYSAEDPQPDFDEDGESLLYLFNFLKSHLSLLGFAEETGKIIVFGEHNPQT